MPKDVPYKITQHIHIFCCMLVYLIFFISWYIWNVCIVVFWYVGLCQQDGDSIFTIQSSRSTASTWHGGTFLVSVSISTKLQNLLISICGRNEIIRNIWLQNKLKKKKKKIFFFFFEKKKNNFFQVLLFWNTTNIARIRNI